MHKGKFAEKKTGKLPFCHTLAVREAVLRYKSDREVWKYLKTKTNPHQD